MGKKYDFDYIVIGSGPAGSSVALQLAKTKKRIALVEGRFWGGSNLNTRDVPYAVALDFSHTYSKIQSYPELKNQDLSFNLPTIPAHELKTIVEVGGNDKSRFETAGITCLKGYANFLDKHTIAIDEKKFTATNFIIATGSKPKISEISGTEKVEFLIPETAIKTHRLPKAVAVVGAGASGCEIAEYFAELGTKVILLETSDRILPREDKEVGDTLSEYFSQKLGITVLPRCKVVALNQDNYSKSVIFHHDNSEKMVRVDCIVLATGCQPNLDYGLENAGIKYKNTGIVVNKLFETSAKNIYAIGDSLGQDSSTDHATQEGLTLASNIINKTKNPINYSGIIRVVKTRPEIATVGLNEDDLIRRDRKYKKAIIKLDEIPASKIYNFSHGFIKLISNKNNHIIGATIMAPNAELMINEISLAIRHNLTAIELASTPHPVNSFSQIIRLSAKKLLELKK